MGFLVSSLILPTSCITPSFLLRKGFGFLGRVSRGCLGGRVSKGISDGACWWHIWWRLVGGVTLAVWLFGLSGFHINPLSWRSNGVSSQRLIGWFLDLPCPISRQKWCLHPVPQLRKEGVCLTPSPGSPLGLLYLPTLWNVSIPKFINNITECQHSEIHQSVGLHTFDLSVFVATLAEINYIFGRVPEGEPSIHF